MGPQGNTRLGRIEKFAKLASLAVFALCVFISRVQADTPTGNVVSGSVEIFDRNNKRLEDHSNMVVFVEGAKLAQNSTTQANIPKISHKGRQFSPRVLPINKGGSVDFFNDDSIYHNVFSLARAKPFDLGIYPEGTSKIVSFERTGLVKLYCNIHPNMVSNVLVLNNPFFATTDADGAYEIQGLPDGAFVIRVWSEFGAQESRAVDLNGGGRYEENFSVSKTRVFVQHKNKFGMPYREKY
ncbi:MAG: carboxypeptidase regulatory-like domain-containing protein [Pseudomonadales bacterium]